MRPNGWWFLFLQIGYCCWCWDIWWVIRYNLSIVSFKGFEKQWNVEKTKTAGWGQWSIHLLPLLSLSKCCLSCPLHGSNSVFLFELYIIHHLFLEVFFLCITVSSWRARVKFSLNCQFYMVGTSSNVALTISIILILTKNCILLQTFTHIIFKEN